MVKLRMKDWRMRIECELRTKQHALKSELICALVGLIRKGSLQEHRSGKDATDIMFEHMDTCIHSGYMIELDTCYHMQKEVDVSHAGKSYMGLLHGSS